jgi:hypothetical protein
VPRIVVYSLAVLSILIIAAGYVGWTLLKQQEPIDAAPTPTPEQTLPPKPVQTDNSTATETPTEEPTSTVDPTILLLQQVEQARNDAVMFLETNHPEVAFLFTEDDWQSSSSQSNQQYEYGSGNWNVTITISAASNLTFSVTIRYSGDWQVNWQGTDQNGTVTENTYSSDIPKGTPMPTSNF